jgi:hypothetical protein
MFWIVIAVSLECLDSDWGTECPSTGLLLIEILHKIDSNKALYSWLHISKIRSNLIVLLNLFAA